jgi:exosome complex exonuclease DIS3/RRP44
MFLSCCAVLQGTLRVNRFNAFQGWLSSESVGQDILVSGRVDMNRAMDGDVVAGAE